MLIKKKMDPLLLYVLIISDLATIENNMRAVGMCVGDVENQDERKLRTRVANPK
jgi:hypothetical protein